MVGQARVRSQRRDAGATPARASGARHVALLRLPGSEATADGETPGGSTAAHSEGPGRGSEFVVRHTSPDRHDRNTAPRGSAPWRGYGEDVTPAGDAEKSA